MEEVSYLDFFDAAENLEIALNALMCFNEFCEDEGMKPSKTLDDEKAISFTLRSRLPQFISILHLAMNNIKIQKDKLEVLAEKLRLQKKEVNV